MNSIITWLVSNLLWVILSGAFIAIIIKPIQALLISKKILHLNRETFGNGFGTKSADVFVSLWNRNLWADQKVKQICLNIIGSSHIERERTIGSIAKKDLEELKLVEFFEKDQSQCIKAIKSWRNKLVYFFTKIWLIYVFGDKPEYYKQIVK